MHGIWISDASRRKIIEYKLKGHNSERRRVEDLPEFRRDDGI